MGLWPIDIVWDITDFEWRCLFRAIASQTIQATFGLGGLGFEPGYG
jgi:hypothetical protein